MIDSLVALYQRLPDGLRKFLAALGTALALIVTFGAYEYRRGERKAEAKDRMQDAVTAADHVRADAAAGKDDAVQAALADETERARKVTGR